MENPAIASIGATVLDASACTASMEWFSGAVRSVPVGRIERLAMEFCRKRNVSLVHLKGHERSKWIVRPRQEFMWLACSAGFSLQHIADFLGNRHHTTVLHGRDAYKRRTEEQGQ